ncbi:MAG TPA: SDR family NAD(P)-dependent oxidoreductase, partial [Gallicola sp.]|nr:SDR family NAD(P)-dependent oxidoreductase [Gallicola sp.]
MFNPFTLNGKTIFVTGASSGIGRAIAIESSKMGANVIITGRNEERLKKTYYLLKGSGHGLIVADLSVKEDIERLHKELPVID